MSAGQIYYPRHRRCKKSITSSINRSNAPITSCKINVHKRNPLERGENSLLPSFLPSFLPPFVPPLSHILSLLFFRKTPLQQYPQSISLAFSRERERERERRQMSHGSLLVNFFPTKTRKRLQQHRRFSQLLPLFHPLFSPLFFHTPFPFVAAISATDLAFSSPDFCKSPDNLSPRAVRLRAKPRLRFFLQRSGWRNGWLLF